MAKAQILKIIGEDLIFNPKKYPSISKDFVKGWNEAQEEMRKNIKVGISKT